MQDRRWANVRTMVTETRNLSKVPQGLCVVVGCERGHLVRFSGKQPAVTDVRCLAAKSGHCDRHFKRVLRERHCHELAVEVRARPNSGERLQ